VGDVAWRPPAWPERRSRCSHCNPFETPQPTGLQLLIEVDDQRRDGELVEALLEEGPVRAGGTVGCSCGSSRGVARARSTP
jgi:hypothetical protein